MRPVHSRYAVVLVTLLVCHPLFPATIEVNETCTLVDAIHAVNNDDAKGRPQDTWGKMLSQILPSRYDLTPSEEQDRRAGDTVPWPFDSSVSISGDTINGCDWVEVAKLTAPDAAQGDEFGWSVSISGDTVVVGASRDDDAGQFSGSAYVSERNAGGANAWGEVAKLTADDATEGDTFGVAVSISGNTIVVGADRDDDAATNSGSAYVFERNTGGADAWGQMAKLTADDPGWYDWLGYSVSIGGDTVVVGAIGDDDGGPLSGSAYVFERNAGGADAWGQVAKLTADDPTERDTFGLTVSVSGDTVIVGAYSDDAGPKSGSAYVFERNAGGADAWGQVAKLTAADAAAEDAFGGSVSISEDTVLVGAWGDDDAGSESGSAYVFERNAGGADTWGQVAKLTPDDANPEDYFGGSVSVSGDSVVVGAPAEVFTGAAYVFERNAGGVDAWGQVAKVTATAFLFGAPVSISGDTVVVGDWADNDAGDSSGSAYVFTCLAGGCCTDGPGTESDCIVTSQADCETGGGLFLGLGTECRPDIDCTALLVTMQAMSAEAVEDGVLVRWTTAMETDTVGFRVLRQSRDRREKALQPVGPMIPALGSEVEGGSYEVLDDSPAAAWATHYFIEDIDLFGTVTRHGPIAVDRGVRDRRTIRAAPHR